MNPHHDPWVKVGYFLAALVGCAFRFPWRRQTSGPVVARGRVDLKPCSTAHPRRTGWGVVGVACGPSDFVHLFKIQIISNLWKWKPHIYNIHITCVSFTIREWRVLLCRLKIPYDIFLPGRVRWVPFPSLPRSSKYIVSRCLGPLKALSGGVCRYKHLLTRYLED